MIIGFSPQEEPLWPVGILADGASILVRGGDREGTRFGLHLLPLQPGANGSPELTPVMSESSVSGADVSPDGRWLTYASNETGRDEVYLRSIGADGSVGSRTQVSTTGGTSPLFMRVTAAAPMEIHYQKGRHLMVVSVKTDPVVKCSEPRQTHDLDRLEERRRTHLPGGRLLIAQGARDEGEIREFKIVLNFHEVIKRKFAKAE